MGIYGTALRLQGSPAGDRELHAMAISLGQNPEKSACFTLPDIGMGTCGRGSESICCSDLAVVVCDADLYNPERPPGGESAKWIAELYRTYRRSLLEHLRGNFSIAIWDRQERELLLSVDRFGVKRLCYAEHGSGIVFASQPRGILASGRVAKEVDLSAVTDYLVYNVVPIPRTAFTGVRYLAPGQYLRFTAKGTSCQRYWNMSYPEDLHGSERNLAGDLLDRMENSVRVTSKDLNPAKSGCFLSGGTDSSSIVGLLTRTRRAPVHAFSIGFAEDRFNELEYANVAAEHFGANHVKTLLESVDAQGVIHRIVDAYDEPFGNASAVPSYWCAKLAREHGVEVLLAGDGGDELFGGNERYRKNQVFQRYQRIPLPLRQKIIEPAIFRSTLKSGVVRKAENYIRQANTSNPERYCQWRLLRRFDPEFVLGGGMPFRNGHSDLLATIRAHYREAPATSELNRLLYVDLKMTLGDDDLPKVTRMASLAGVQVRFPYLDHPLADFTGRLRTDLKVRGLEKRYLFKRATSTLLPSAILQKKKHGFGLPIGLWLKTDRRLRTWANEILLDSRAYQRGYFRRQFIEHLFCQMENDSTPYFGDLLYVFLMLELWHRRHVELSAC